MSIANIIDPEVLGNISMEKLASMIPNLTGVDSSGEFAIPTPGTSWQIPYNKVLPHLPATAKA